MKPWASCIVAITSMMLLAGSAPPLQVSRTMCKPAEVALFSCPIGRHIVSVCGAGSTATYRFGLPGHVQVEAANGLFATRGYSGGGETQIAFERRGYSYVVYDRLVRTGFGEDGHHDPEQSSGVLVLKGTKIAADRHCSGTNDHGIDSTRPKRLPQGRFVER
jgi:hypothetical protein